MNINKFFVQFGYHSRFSNHSPISPFDEILFINQMLNCDHNIPIMRESLKCGSLFVCPLIGFPPSSFVCPIIGCHPALKLVEDLTVDKRTPDSLSISWGADKRAVIENYMVSWTLLSVFWQNDRNIWEL